MVDRDIIEEWITKADEDFEFARITIIQFANESTKFLSIPQSFQ